MRVIAHYIGRLYYWIKYKKYNEEGNSWKKFFWQTDYTQEESNREYYTGLGIIIGVSAVLFFGYLFYLCLIDELP